MEGSTTQEKKKEKKKKKTPTNGRHLLEVITPASVGEKKKKGIVAYPPHLICLKCKSSTPFFLRAAPDSART